MLEFATVFQVNTLEMECHGDYIRVDYGLLSKMSEVVSLKEFKINGCSIMRNQNYDEKELATLQEKINERFRKNLTLENNYRSLFNDDQKEGREKFHAPFM